MRNLRLPRFPRTPALLAAGSALLALSAAAAQEQGAPAPTQLQSYREAAALWGQAASESDEGQRRELLERARAGYLAAAAPEPFPLAALGLALMDYGAGDLYHAEERFRFVAGETTGAARAEANAYLGMIALRSRDWKGASERFQAVLAEPGAVPNLWKERARRNEAVARAGAALAAYYQLRPPAAALPSPEQWIGLWTRLGELLPDSAASRLAGAVDGRSAAVWRLAPAPGNPGNRPEWASPPGGAGREGAQPISLDDLRRTLALYAGSQAAFRPPSVPPGPDGLPEADRRNLAFGLLTRLSHLERDRDWTGALAVAERLAAMPETAVVARQHRIWIRLETAVDLDEARRLAHGPAAAADPLLFDELCTLGLKLAEAGRDAEAGEQFRHVIAGAASRQARPPLKGLAEWNTAALALRDAAARQDPERLKEALEILAPAPGREYARLALTYRLALARLNARRPAEEVESALKQADAIATGAEADGTRPIPGGDRWMHLFLRHLAARAMETGQEPAYAGGFFKRTDYPAQFHAWEAYQQFTRTRPGTGEAWEPIIDRLEVARRMAVDAHLREILDWEIGRLRAYQRDHSDYVRRLEAHEGPRPLVEAWNRAADATYEANRTNKLRGATQRQVWDAWNRAAAAWRVVQPLAPAGSAESEEAAGRIVRSHMKQADAMFDARYKKGAAADLVRAARALDELELNREEEAVLALRVEHNQRVLDGTGFMLPERPGRPRPLRDAKPAASPSTTALAGPARGRLWTPQAWLERLEKDDRAREAFVGWLNRGPLAVKTPGALRDFSADPRSRRYVVTYLRRNLADSLALLPKGAPQWRPHPRRAGTWVRVTSNRPEAAIALANGVPLVNARDGNPLGAIQVVPAPWIHYQEWASWRRLPPAPYPVANPDLAFQRPSSDFTFPEFTLQTLVWAPTLHGAQPEPPLIVLAVAPQPPPE